MVIVTQEAIDDVGTFYGNVAKQYPNTWDDEKVQNAINNVLDGMNSVIITSLQGEKKPLLTTLQDVSNVAELSLVSRGKRYWYFTVRIDGENIYIENAIYSKNESQRAYRRGKSNPTAPLSADDRTTQQRITESKLLEIIRESIIKYLF